MGKCGGHPGPDTIAPSGTKQPRLPQVLDGTMASKRPYRQSCSSCATITGARGGRERTEQGPRNPITSGITPSVARDGAISPQARCGCQCEELRGQVPVAARF